MAQWGKGDPRWIVENRPDGTNVNNWHWTESNASFWSKTKFIELLIGLKTEAEDRRCEITEMLNCEGDAVVYNRKGKLFFFYEWNLEMKWNGAVGKGPVIEGRIGVVNFTEEQDFKNTTITAYFDNNDADSAPLGSLMQSEGGKIIQERLSAYVKALKEDFAKDLILPCSYIHDVEMTTVKNVPEKRQSNEQNCANVTQNVTEIGDVYVKETFKCTAEEIYRILTVKDYVQAFTQSNCILEAVEGGSFKLFDGNVQGIFIRLEPFQRIHFSWRFSTWPKDHFSYVVIFIDQKSDCTEVTLSQVGVPIEEIENTREGWKNHYWDSIKRIFGVGSFLI